MAWIFTKYFIRLLGTLLLHPQRQNENYDSAWLADQLGWQRNICKGIKLIDIKYWWKTKKRVSCSSLRQETFAKMESELNKWVPKKEDRLFYHHPSEDHVVLSHAMFWVMSGYIRGKINKDKYFCLLRKYQERMLDAYLMDKKTSRNNCTFVRFCMRCYQ